MRMTTLQDVKYLSGAAGSDPMVDPYDGHAVCVEDSAVEGTWRSYETAIDINLWSADRTDGGDNMDCAMVVAEQGNDPATDRYRLVDYDCTTQMPFICERPRTVQNTGKRFVYSKPRRVVSESRSDFGSVSEFGLWVTVGRKRLDL